MRRYLILILLMLSPLQVAAAGSQGDEDETVRRVTVRVDLSGDMKGRARLWLPYPVSDAIQTISDISVQGNMEGWSVYTDGRWGNAMLYAWWPDGKPSRTLVFSFTVRRSIRSDSPDAARGGVCLDRTFFYQYLQGSDLAPVTGSVAALAGRIVSGRGSVTEKARAVYDWVADNMRRDPGVTGCGSGSVCVLLDRRRGKCADIHSVFVALLKAAGIPAREVFGLRLGGENRVDITGWQHCWAEFYVPGSGWVVADPGDYLKALLTRSLSPASEEARRIREYYFGKVDSRRVKFGSGRDVVLNPPQEGGPLNYFMYPYAEAGGKAVDFLNPQTFSYHITSEPVAGQGEK